MSDAQLEILASQAGLAVDWIDANGRPQKVQPAVLRAILTGLGHPAGSAQEIDASLLQLQQRQALNRLPPLLTVDVGSGLDLSRYFAAHTPCEIQLEDGAVLNLKLDDNAVLPGLLPVGYQEVSIADLQQRVAKTLAFVQGFSAAQIDGTEDKDIVTKRGDVETHYKGMQFLLNHAMPNIYFHVTTVYAILRHNGVEIGKRDYLGKV